jgi:hypothetical protein
LHRPFVRRLCLFFLRHLQGHPYRTEHAALSWEEPRTARAEQSPLLVRKESFGREMADLISPYRFDFHVIVRDFERAANLRHRTHSFTSLPKEGMLRIFYARKKSTASAEFEPTILGTRGQHANH